jgi:radical SAM protein with 4Fe4S-binding SPASM domain
MYMSRYLKDPKDPDILNMPCKIGHKNFLVDPFGNVRICSLMEPIGNLRDELPGKIWNSEKARNQRRKIRECTKPCRLLTCTFKERCTGHDRFVGCCDDFFAANVYCHIRRTRR